ncbi:small ribosomal subunit protein uS14-like [Neofelis nebulosa]|uniref:small ribosomal subunit protein uS14-like n=1 Tax=Neofelis nebulosa TaxID=61452 RepID=UPI00272D1156|nr:small ribosomal subunit protein uS14-like [Neofelis nebulosa]XP_060467729.1 small ribosomal subunit protein uS14-like [Panthera onca]
MGHQELYCGHPRKFGLGCHSCPICTNRQSLMWKYCVTMCLQGLLQYGKNMGFIKLDYVSSELLGATLWQLGLGQ